MCVYGPQRAIFCIDAELSLLAGKALSTIVGVAGCQSLCQDVCQFRQSFLT